MHERLRRGVFVFWSVCTVGVYALNIDMNWREWATMTTTTIATTIRRMHALRTLVFVLPSSAFINILILHKIMYILFVCARGTKYLNYFTNNTTHSHCSSRCRWNSGSFRVISISTWIGYHCIVHILASVMRTLLRINVDNVISRGGHQFERIGIIREGEQLGRGRSIALIAFKIEHSQCTRN